MEVNASRHQLLEWVNHLCNLHLTQIEQCASGAVYLQIFDALLPGAVPMQKVKWNAKYEYEYIQNYKILQTVFARANIDKPIEIDKLVKAKYQDNLEFFQWVKGFYDKVVGNSSPLYDGEERRRISGSTMPPWARIEAQRTAARVTQSYKSVVSPKSASRRTLVIGKTPSGKDDMQRPAAKSIAENSASNVDNVFLKQYSGAHVLLKEGLNGEIAENVQENTSHNTYFPALGAIHEDANQEWPPKKSPKSNSLTRDKIKERYDTEGAAHSTGIQTSSILPLHPAKSPDTETPSITSGKEDRNLASAKDLDATLDVKHSDYSAKQFEYCSGSLNDRLSSIVVPTTLFEVDTSRDAAIQTLKMLEDKIAYLENALAGERKQQELLKQLLHANMVEKETAFLEKEFFYNKLRKLEIMCDEADVSVPVSNIFEVLYATDDVNAEILGHSEEVLAEKNGDTVIEEVVMEDASEC